MSSSAVRVVPVSALMAVGLAALAAAQLQPVQRALVLVKPTLSLDFDSEFGPTLFALGDLNADGVGDVAVQRYFAGVGPVQWGDGRPALDVGTRRSPNPLRADLDGDGVLDVAFGATGFSARLQQPFYTIVSPRPEPQGDLEKRIVALGDLTGDGVSDFAVRAPGEYPTRSAASSPTSLCRWRAAVGTRPGSTCRGGRRG